MTMESLAYISLIIASTLYFIGFIMLFRYKRDKIKYLDEQLAALNNLLDSSDKMVDELNNLSDYVITNIEDKTKDLKKLLTIADEKIKDYKLASNYNFKPSDKLEVKSSEIRNHNNAQKNFEYLIEDITKIKKPDFEKIVPQKRSFSAVVGAYENTKSMYNNLKNEDLIEKSDSTNNINTEREQSHEAAATSRQSQIERLLNEGLTTTDIAKRLGIGKGEVELIVGLKK